MRFVLVSLFRLLQRSHHLLISLIVPVGLVKELQTQSAELEFEISLKAVSVLRYITDHTERYGRVCVWVSGGAD